jgi:hypothetical protein
MGLFDNIFGGGNRERTRDESSVQADINRGLKESGGKFTPEINSLVAERERARSGGASSGGLGSLSAGLGRAVDTVRSIPGNFARDVRMGTSANVFANRDKQAENLANRGFSQREIQDYFARTDATIARDAAQEAARQNEGPSDAEMAAVRMGAEDIPPEDQMPRYRNPFGTMPGAPGQMPGSPNALTVFPQPPEITLQTCAVRHCVSLNRSVAQDKSPIRCCRISRAWEACLAQMLAQRSSMRHKTISALVAHSA